MRERKRAEHTKHHCVVIGKRHARLQGGRCYDYMVVPVLANKVLWCAEVSTREKDVVRSSNERDCFGPSILRYVGRTAVIENKYSQRLSCLSLTACNKDPLTALGCFTEDIKPEREVCCESVLVPDDGRLEHNFF